MAATPLVAGLVYELAKAAMGEIVDLIRDHEAGRPIALPRYIKVPEALVSAFYPDDGKTMPWPKVFAGEGESVEVHLGQPGGLPVELWMRGTNIVRYDASDAEALGRALIEAAATSRSASSR